MNIIDMAIIDELRTMLGDDAPGVLSDLVSEFIDESSALVTRIEGALAAREFDVVCECAHKMIAPARSFGAHPLGDLARELEDAAAAGDEVTVQTTFARLKQMFADVERVLRAIATSAR